MTQGGNDPKLSSTEKIPRLEDPAAVLPKTRAMKVPRDEAKGHATEMVLVRQRGVRQGVRQGARSAHSFTSLAHVSPQWKFYHTYL